MTRTRSWLVIVLVALSSLVAGGCALSRSEVKLSAPAMDAGAPASGPVVVIRSVKDERTFEQAPRDPSTPSLGGEGASGASADLKSRAIGRKRNTYGQALGDVVLEPGRTVEGVVRENLAAGLRKAGYAVRDAGSAGSSPIFLDVRIRRFWAWLTPGFWAITLRSNVETTITISGGNSAVDVSVTAEQSGMAATDTSWIEVVDNALRLYREQVATKMSGLK